MKVERLAELQNLLWEQQNRFNESFVGRVLSVLLEKEGRHDGQLVGKSPYLQSVHMSASLGLIGEIVPARISTAGPNSLGGEVAEMMAQ